MTAYVVDGSLKQRPPLLEGGLVDPDAPVRLVIQEVAQRHFVGRHVALQQNFYITD